jgi:hypothetical protein
LDDIVPPIEMSSVDPEVRYSINNLITRQISKEPILQPEILKKLKNILKKSDDNVRVAFDQIFLQMETPNSTVWSCDFIVETFDWPPSHQRAVFKVKGV